jgi:heterodisulfide reductase subunit C
MIHGKSFVQRIRAVPGGEHLTMCYSCGTCVSKCMVQQKVEPGYNPRRLLRKAMTGLDQEAFQDITGWLCSACDLCYAACPQKIHISGVIGAIKELAVEAGQTSPLKTAMVNEQTCVACGLCVEVCPYEAVSLQEIRSGRQSTKTVARVNSNRCLACGLCAANCRSASVEIQDEFSFEILLDEFWNWMGQKIWEAER